MASRQRKARAPLRFLGGQGRDILKAGVDLAVILPTVGKQTAGAVLSAAFGIAESPAALVAQCIERAIAEKAVEILPVRALVAGKKLTVPVLKIRIVLA